MSFNQDLKTQIRMFVAMALAVATGLVTANAASAGFADVPEEAVFADSINRVQEAGIATGYGDGTFRPRNSISRQQAAAWLDRTASRVGLDINNGGTATTLSSSTPSAVLSEIEITSPASWNGNGWVTIQGGVGGLATDPGTTCPCTVDLFVYDQDDGLVARSALTTMSDPTGTAAIVAPIYGIGAIAGGATNTYRLVATLSDSAQEVHVSGGLYLQYSPMVEGEPDSFPSGSSTSTESDGRPSAPVIDLDPID